MTRTRTRPPLARGLGQARAARDYVWDDVARAYEALCERVAKQGRW